MASSCTAVLVSANVFSWMVIATGNESGAGIFDPATHGRRLKNPLLPVLAFALLLLLAVWAYSAHARRVYVYTSEMMSRAKDIDKVLVGILKNFSLDSVHDFYFRGIKQKGEPVSVAFRNISTTLKGGNRFWNGCRPEPDKTLLEDVTGEFHAGRMSAIMGPSGAGKTTFLNVLCGKTRAGRNWDVSGLVFVNDEETDIADLKNVIGFVPQEDVVHEGLTVRENIRFSAMLRNARGISARRLKMITEDVLQVLQLEAHQNVLVGNRTFGREGLSGGQRKRVNIGLELAACPSLLFLDEPTSGLDATSSLLLCEMLKKMTGLGMTVVMVIHQPRFSLFTLIDDVLLLGKGGRSAYVGPTSGAKAYLQRLGFALPLDENPADWMMDILSGRGAIENAQMPSETLPEALFEAWERAGCSDSSGPLESRLQRGRSADDSEDQDVIRRHIKDEWEKISSDAGSLNCECFHSLLESCLGCEIKDRKIVEELMLRATGKLSCEDITQQQFIKYLLMFRSVNRRGVTANSSLDDLEAGNRDSSSGETSGSEGADQQQPQDLGRVQTGFWVHLRVVVERHMLEFSRTMKVRLFFLAIMEVAGVFLGFFDAIIFQSPPWSPTVLLNSHISLALLISVHSLTCFSRDQPMYWREASHGLNRVAFMIGRMIVDTIDWMTLTFFFTATYYCLVLPELRFNVYIIPFLLVSHVASGWGYLVSCTLPPVLAPFCVAVLCFMIGGILGLPEKMERFLDGSILEAIVGIVCFTRWSVPMDFLAYVYRQPLNVTTMGVKLQYQYNMYLEGYTNSSWLLPLGPAAQWWTGQIVLLTMGFALRFACYPALRFMNASKQV